MNAPQSYILLSIVVLGIIMVILVLAKKKAQKPLSKLSGIAFLFVIAGIFFGEKRLIGYSLMGIGVIFAIIDIIGKNKNPGIKNE